jgi:alkanesulfonate monooxygenase SsuD/methylene tetrahydromethanopterin reductase-like flavin-dependent oxidoreductase (luciferase family)
MKFGVFYVLECPDHDYRRAYAEMLAQIEAAESLGYDTVWLAEHHGTDYGSMPSPQVIGAAVAQRTKRMRIGIACSILPFAHPVRLAEDYAMLDVLSDGRLDFGVGRGYQPREFKAMGVEHLQPVSREVFREQLEIILGLWTNDTFSYQGEYFQVEEVSCRPKPVQTPHPPVLVAAISPQTFELVAQGGYNILVTPTLMTLPELQDHVVETKRTLIERGREPLSLDFPMNWQIHVAPTEEQALAETEQAFAWYFNEVMKHVPKGANVPKTYERYAELAKAVEEGGGLTIEGLQQGGIVLVTDPATAVREIEKLHDEMGLQHISCWMRMGGLEHDKVISSLELFAKEVIPHFKDRPPVVPRALRSEAVTA